MKVINIIPETKVVQTIDALHETKVVQTIDTLPYDILNKIIQELKLNASILCNLAQVSKSFQICADDTETWTNIYDTTKKQVCGWLEDAKKRQIILTEIRHKATANRDASLKILNERATSLTCEHCRICDPRTVQDILNEQIYFMSQEQCDTKTIHDILNELTNSMIHKQCTTLCCRKTGREYKGYNNIYNNKSNAISSWKLNPLVRNEASIDKTIAEYRVCDDEVMEAIFTKYMILRSFREPEWRPNRPKIIN